jgi:hypothetical protein
MHSPKESFIDPFPDLLQTLWTRHLVRAFDTLQQGPELPSTILGMTLLITKSTRKVVATTRELIMQEIQNQTHHCPDDDLLEDEALVTDQSSMQLEVRRNLHPRHQPLRVIQSDLLDRIKLHKRPPSRA